MIRKAEEKDIQNIADTYTRLLTYEQEHGSNSGWKLNLYPTIEVPQQAVPTGNMYVLEENGEICASMILNSEQAEEYTEISWLYPASDEQVLVIHTLCIPPEKAGRGYGTAMLNFAKEYGREHGMTVIRMDTWLHNEPAKKLYLKNGFQIAGTGKILLHGVIDEDQVYLEGELK